MRPKLTYANVVATLALFIALGGASYAAIKLPKNSVGGKQIKKSAVTTSKLHKAAVTTSKISDHAVTGEKIALGTLGTVPNAANAAAADSANSAAHVNGQTPYKIAAILLSGESHDIGSVAGFTMAATCSESDVGVTLTSPKAIGSVLAVDGIDAGTDVPYSKLVSQKAGTAAQINLDNGLSGSYGHASFSGGLSDGTVISGEIGYDEDTFFGEAPERCMVFGEVGTG